MLKIKNLVPNSKILLNILLKIKNWLKIQKVWSKFKNFVQNAKMLLNMLLIIKNFVHNSKLKKNQKLSFVKFRIRLEQKVGNVCRYKRVRHFYRQQMYGFGQMYKYAWLIRMSMSNWFYWRLLLN